MNNSTSKAFFFDLDNTLFDYEASFKQASLFAFISILHPVLNKPINPEKWFKVYKTFCDLYWPAYEKKMLTREEYQRNRLVSSLLSFNIQLFDQRQMDAFRKRFEEEIPSFVQPYPWVEEMINFIKMHGYVAGIISNGESVLQRKKLSMLGLSFSESHTYISSELSFAKPSIELFNYVKSKICAEQFYYVGDSFSLDIHPAIKAGWTGIWWNPSKQIPELLHPNLYNCQSADELNHVIKKCIE
ncbi:HAD family hydrolase [Fictibacillus phosphorivorans]|uniref:HAD family hydrolase n=1 Tax=Fictibacillus phosphorivorans TaxID=1221500 RepID=UPI00203E8FE5|nr:HAD family hydrolase [Fictibacillus phosphorivorans]MCM3716809.1 HAD family hydrolase [Fictibacillus phosphorivorans]MCM3774642.1 HAD family hydrolase [Fictibacillus phosphorivorans]